MRNKFLAVALCAMCLSVIPVMQASTAFAAETYSDNWFMDSESTWHYKMSDGSMATDAWIHDHGEWYLLDSNGNMLTGLVKSNGGKYYLLDTVRGTGTYGKMLKNGGTYNSTVISASVNADDEGSLSADTIEQLRASGVSIEEAPNVENTKHVENGAVTLENTPTSDPSGSENAESTTGTSNPFEDAADNPEITGGGSGVTKDIPVYGGISTDNPWGIAVGTGKVEGEGAWGSTKDIPVY